MLAQCADAAVRASIGLGGNASFIVFADADLDDAVDGAMVAMMRNLGEAYTAANRMSVHCDVAGEFSARLAERIGALTVGPGDQDGVDVGPLIEAAGRDDVETLVRDVVDRGVAIVVVGHRPDAPGTFDPPTVLADVTPDTELIRTEIFGPVAAGVAFDDEQEVLRLANDTTFGLVGYFFTRDLDRALRMGEGLATGMVGINAGLVSNPAAPFGGVKLSGLGRDGGRVGIDDFPECNCLAVPRG